MMAKFYTIFNIGIICLILSIFLYSFFLNPNEVHGPVHCVHQYLTEKPCPVCGNLSGIGAILHFNYFKAKQEQSNSLSFFVFYLLQFAGRIFLTFLLLKKRIAEKCLMSVDVSVSFLTFFILFRNIIPQVLYIFYKMALTGIH
jgi:hypothetical protein